MRLSHIIFLRPRRAAITICLLLLAMTFSLPADYLSHPPLRQAPPPSDRPMDDGPGYYVDPADGDDSAPGTKEAPWKSIGHALEELRPGDTLYLRGGVYYENVYLARAGEADRPITLRSFPGELAVIDGGLREFFETPGQAWEPVPNGAEGEFRSTGYYPNIRDVTGMFGDSMVGLQTYWHRKDLVSENELWFSKEEGADIEPVYVGPGVWYDQDQGRIHVRLAHTHIDNPGVRNYRGTTDPREIPLVIGPFRSVPLYLDRAQHIRLQDLVIRGGGYDSVVMRQCQNIDFDNVVVWGGTYGLRSQGSSHVRFYRSALYGAVPPWCFRTENSLRVYPGREHLRDIARLTGHASLVLELDEESSVYYFPRNTDWEISYSEFTDNHDGVYLVGHRLWFHNNLLDNFHDDAMFLSGTMPDATDQVFIYHNLITHSLMPFSMAGRLPASGEVFIFRNIIDMRRPSNRSRPTPDNPQGTLENISPFKWHHDLEAYYIYQNTLIIPTVRFGFAGRAFSHLSATAPRRVFNNIFVYLGDYPAYRIGNAPDGVADAVIDHNLHWSVTQGNEAPADYLENLNTHELSAANQEHHPDGWGAHSIIADPVFLSFDPGPDGATGFGLDGESPALGAGLVLPEEWKDPDRPEDGSPPDLGALPGGAAPFKVGRDKMPVTELDPR